MSLRLLRAEIWARDDVKKLHRATVRSLPDGEIEGPAVVVMSRLVVTGGNHHRLHEELTEAGGYMRDTGFRREGVTEVRRWLEQSQPAALSDATFDALRTRFDKQRDNILAAVDARSKDRLRFLVNTIETRKRKEAEDIRQVLDDLEKALKTEIAAEQIPVQLSLFSEDERTQLKRDLAALEARLARIPNEREQELKAIEERHSNAVDHTFPVALVLLVPDSLATEKRR